MTTLAEYRSSRELLNNLTLRELRSKYKRSVLGWTWSLLNPLATMLIFTLVFRFFLRIEAPVSKSTDLHSFSLYLLCGLLPWNFFVNGVTASMGSLVGNANLIKKTYFPRELLVIAQVNSWIVSLLIEMALLAVGLIVFGNMVLPWLPVAILLMALLAMFVTGLALAFSVLNVYFRDIQHFVGILFQVWFYLTPIVYPLPRVPERADIFGNDLPVRALFHVNPMVDFVEAFRAILYDLQAPSLGILAYLLVVSVVSLVGGMWLFGRLEGKLAEEL
ncbi:MAG TPA: ABC transporter permease [Acidimicrobiales bacterium]|nr:ABC transporter permease [Acidimicrobiales bacterium]